MLTQQAAALAAAGSAVGAVLVVVVFLLLRRAPRPQDEQPTGRGRFPARYLERALFVGVASLVCAALAVWELDFDIAVGLGAVVVGLFWVWWRGTFLPLRAGETPRG